MTGKYAIIICKDCGRVRVSMLASGENQPEYDAEIADGHYGCRSDNENIPVECECYMLEDEYHRPDFSLDELPW